MQTVQLKQLLFICGKLQIGNGFLQCYQISHNTRIRWGFFCFFFSASSFLVTNIKCKAGGRVRLMNELRHQAKIKLVKKPGHDAHTSVSVVIQIKFKLVSLCFPALLGSFGNCPFVPFYERKCYSDCSRHLYYILSKYGW